MLKSSHFITAKFYAIIMGVSYATAKKYYSIDKDILGITKRKMYVREFCALHGYTLEELNEVYNIA